jgi:hypothetical protein
MTGEYMSIFAKHLATLKEGQMTALPLGAVAVESLDEQRARRNHELATGADLGLESQIDAAMPVGPGTTDEKLVTGDHGEDASITHKPGGDVHVDADFVTTKHVAEEDTDGDDDGIFEPMDDDDDDTLDVFIKDGDELEALEATMMQVARSAIAIESFGINPSALGVLQAVGLLEGTALQSMALEGFTFDSPKGDETAMALEALATQMNETEGKWSAKIVSVVHGAADKVMGVLKPMFDKIGAMSSKLASAGWDKAKAAGRTMKAHPLATVAAALTAAALAAGVVIYVTQGFPAPNCKMPDMKKFMEGLAGHINKLESPLGKVTATVNAAGTRIATTFTRSAAAMQSGTSTALGWTQAGVKVITGKASAAMSATSKAWTAAATRLPQLFDAAKKAPGQAKAAASKAGAFGAKVSGHVVTDALMQSAKFGSRMMDGDAAGATAAYIGYIGYVMVIGAIITKLVSIVKFFIIGAFKMVMAAFRSVASAVGGSSAAEPAAA